MHFKPLKIKQFDIHYCFGLMRIIMRCILEHQYSSKPELFTGKDTSVTLWFSDSTDAFCI